MTDETVLWRFMGLFAFLDLLSTKELFLTRLDQLGDPHEGRLSKADYDLWVRQQSEAFIQLMDDPKHHLNAAAVEEMTKQLADRELLGPRKTYFVSCWHASDYDSVAMWRLYCPNEQGVAVETTVGRFRSATSEKESGLDQSIQEVEYLDFDKTSVVHTNRNIAFCKRRAYEFEKEVRLGVFQPIDVANSSPQSMALFPAFLRVNVDLQNLLTRVWLPPECQQWQKNCIVALLEAYGLDVEVQISRLLTISEGKCT